MKKVDPDFKGEITEFIAPIKESDKHDWCKGVARIIWGDNPQTLDIRKMNMSQNRIGSGISLSDEEADSLCNILLDNDYGDIETIRKALERKESRFKLQDNTSVIDAEYKEVEE